MTDPTDTPTLWEDEARLRTLLFNALPSRYPSGDVEGHYLLVHQRMFFVDCILDALRPHLPPHVAG